MLIFMLMSLMLSTTLMLVSHPVAILALILVQTMNTCFILWTAMTNSWMAYILFLIFLGGLMVLFMYITSLASNEKFETEISTSYQLISATLVLNIFILTAYFFSSNKVVENINVNSQTMMLFSSPLTMITFMIMTYLLLTLIVAVKITAKFEGPLRSVTKK